jgi:TRAP-type C4-dicarboxylate transport system permease small subunit
MMTMIVLAFLQVVLRNIFAESFLWGDIFLRHLVLWVGFIGASVATRYERHINIDLLSRIVPGRLRLFVQGIVFLFSALAAAWLTRAAWQFVRDEQAVQSMLFENVPVWYFQIIIPVGFGLMAVRFLFQSIERFSQALRKGAV